MTTRELKNWLTCKEETKQNELQEIVIKQDQLPTEIFGGLCGNFYNTL